MAINLKKTDKISLTKSEISSVDTGKSKLKTLILVVIFLASLFSLLYFIATKNDHQNEKSTLSAATIQPKNINQITEENKSSGNIEKIETKSTNDNKIIIYFSSNGAKLNHNEKEKLKSLKNTNVIEIRTYCDQRGKSNYNKQLAQLRMSTIAKELKGNYIQNAIGAENFICTEKDESCYSQNRRAEIILGN